VKGSEPTGGTWRRPKSVLRSCSARGWAVVLVLSLLVGSCPAGLSETVNVSRRLVRFDGAAAAGARVRIVTDHANRIKKPDLEVLADADGVFSVDLTQEDSAWGGHLIVEAQGCAITCEFAVTGRQKNSPWTPVLHLGQSFIVEGGVSNAEGLPASDATVSLICVRPKHGNAIPLNSATTCLRQTGRLVAQSRDGRWSMPGIDFVDGSRHPVSVSAVFEAVGHKTRCASRLEIELDPESAAQPRKNLTLNFTLKPLICVAGRVVDFATGVPLAGVDLTRNVLFTTLDHSSSVTDDAGRFELWMAGPLPLLWFQAYREGFATTTVFTQRREPATSDWAAATNLVLRLRPMVSVSGALLDEEGKPPDEPVWLYGTFDERIDAGWQQQGVGPNTLGGSAQTQVNAEGSFNARLPAGPITIRLQGPPVFMGSGVGPGAPKNYRLDQRVEIPGDGIKGLRLRSTRTDQK